MVVDGRCAVPVLVVILSYDVREGCIIVLNSIAGLYNVAKTKSALSITTPTNLWAQELVPSASATTTSEQLTAL